MDKKKLSETDIRTKFITPAIQAAGWDLLRQVREEVTFTAGRIVVRGRLHTRGKAKRADYVLYHQTNLPLVVIEAKDNNQSVGSGMQQALDYAETLDVPFVFSSNGDGFLFHDRTRTGDQVETELTLTEFPSPAELWARYCLWRGIGNQRHTSSLAIPLPPLAIQRRIVAKVDEFMALCNQLKAGLTESRQLHAHLATALVEQAVA